MKSFQERRAAREATRAEIEATYAAGLERARRIQGETHDAKVAATAELAKREMAEEDAAREKFNVQADKTLKPLLAALHAEPSNAGVVAFAKAYRELDALARVALGEEFHDRRIAYLLAEIHRETRPGIVRALNSAEFWRAGFGGGVPDLYHAIRKAVERGDVAATRTAFEALDARVWSITESAPDVDAEATWAATIAANPSVHRARCAELESRSRETARAECEASCDAAFKHQLNQKRRHINTSANFSNSAHQAEADLDKLITAASR